MNNEEEPKTIEELFVSEYYKLKAQNEQASFDSKYWERNYNDLLDKQDKFKKAFKVLNITIDDSLIEVNRDLIRSDDNGYDELKDIIEQLAIDEDDGE